MEVTELVEEYDKSTKTILNSERGKNNLLQTQPTDKFRNTDNVDVPYIHDKVVLTFSRVKEIVNKYSVCLITEILPYLYQVIDCKLTFCLKVPVVSYKRNRNLSEMLTSSLTKYTDSAKTLLMVMGLCVVLNNSYMI